MRSIALALSVWLALEPLSAVHAATSSFSPASGGAPASVPAIQPPLDRGAFLQELNWHAERLDGAFLPLESGSLVQLAAESPAAARAAASLQARAIGAYLEENLLPETATREQKAAQQALVESIARPSLRAEVAGALGATPAGRRFASLMGRIEEVEAIRPYPLLQGLVELRQRLFDGAGKVRTLELVRGNLDSLFEGNAARAGEPAPVAWAPFQRPSSLRPPEGSPSGGARVPVRVVSAEPPPLTQAGFARRLGQAAAAILGRYVAPVEPELLFYSLLKGHEVKPLTIEVLERISDVGAAIEPGLRLDSRPHRAMTSRIEQAFSSAARLLLAEHRRPIASLEEAQAAQRDMVAALGDRYSRFLKPQELKDLDTEEAEKDMGVGLEFDWRKDARGVTVFRVIPGSPADQAGLRLGDEVLLVNGQSVTTRQQAYSLLAGYWGTTARLTVRRKEGDGVSDFSVDLVRGRLSATAGAYSRMFPGNVGYVYLAEFKPIAYAVVAAFVQDLVQKGMKALILDLRYNPGGDQETVEAIAGLFLRAGQTILRERRREGLARIPKAERDGEFSALPMAVLVNRYTASASEVLSSALRANGQARVIGERTYGKGEGTQVSVLGDGSGVRLGVHHWSGPDGRTVEFDGVPIDVTVALEPGQEAALRTALHSELFAPPAPEARPRDPVLEAALGLFGP